CKAGGRTHTLSLRHCAELAGLSLSTTVKATARVEERHLMRRLDSGTADHGATWLLLAPSRTRHSPKGGAAGPELECVEAENPDERMGLGALRVFAAVMSLDAFSFRGLGASSAKLVAALSEMERPTLPELAAAASVSRPTAYRHLPRLVDLGLVVREGEVYQLSQDSSEAISRALAAEENWEQDWVEVAVALGSDGVSERRRVLHLNHRRRWAEKLQRVVERRGADVVPVRGDEMPQWCEAVGGRVYDIGTGEEISRFIRADDGHLMLEPDPKDEDYERLRMLAREAQEEWESAA
ncbi:helix-turn-helix domain-containing protein, partial [Kitasatospora viridis]